MDSKIPLGVMTLVHKRAKLIPLLCQQVFETWPRAIIDFTADRPTVDVIQALQRAAMRWPGVRLAQAPFPAITHKENYIALRDWQLQRMHHTGCAYVSMLDDDHIFSDPAETRRLMEEENHDLLYITKLYLWDSLDQINTALPVHTSVVCFRRLDGDRWTHMVHAPAQVHASERQVTLKGWLLDVGYLTKAERERVWTVYKRAGKIDALTTGLLAPPKLHDVSKELSGGSWYEKLKELYE